MYKEGWGSTEVAGCTFKYLILISNIAKYGPGINSFKCLVLLIFGDLIFTMMYKRVGAQQRRQMMISNIWGIFHLGDLIYL